MSERLSSSSAAVKPAGPAPAMTAVLPGLHVALLIHVSGRVHVLAVVQVPTIPDARTMMTDGLEAHILFGHHKIQLGIGTDPHQTVVRERQRSRVEFTTVSCAAGK